MLSLDMAKSYKEEIECKSLEYMCLHMHMYPCDMNVAWHGLVLFSLAACVA